MYFVIKVGSITNAQRALKVLRGKGYKPTISRIDNPKAEDGCGYVINVYANDENSVVNILKRAEIKVIGVESK